MVKLGRLSQKGVEFLYDRRWKNIGWENLRMFYLDSSESMRFYAELLRLAEEKAADGPIYVDVTATGAADGHRAFWEDAAGNKPLRCKRPKTIGGDHYGPSAYWIALDEAAVLADVAKQAGYSVELLCEARACRDVAWGAK